MEYEQGICKRNRRFNSQERSVGTVIFKEWIEDIMQRGLLCKEYTEKVIHAKSKKQIMDIVLDVNGASYLLELSAKGFALPYETIRNEFGAYIN
jgi:hypothetical protein